MNFPLQLSFKIVALSPQIMVHDAEGRLVLYVKQKVLKLREAVSVFADEEQSRLVYKMEADRILDFSARYTIATANGERLGALQRRGMRSLWRANYEVVEGDRIVLRIREENPWSRVGDSFLNLIPLIGMVSGYLFHPAYRVTRPDGSLVIRAKKLPAFWEGKFSVTKESEASTWEEALGVLSLLMMLLLERDRG